LVEAEGDVFKDYWLTQIDVHRQMVTAWIANAQGRQEEALQTLRTAADREDAIERDPVVPGPIISARELLGEMLLESDRPQQALQAFEADLRNEPGRFWSLYGAAQAAERAGDRERARSFYSDLVAQTVRADQDRPALKAARTFLQATKGCPAGAEDEAHLPLPPAAALGACRTDHRRADRGVLRARGDAQRRAREDRHSAAAHDGRSADSGLDGLALHCPNADVE